MTDRMARLQRRQEHLQEILDQLVDRMRCATSDQNYTVMSRERRLILAELGEIETVIEHLQPTKETGLSEFERKMAERGTPVPHSAGLGG